jgi:hypothetical protein
VFGITGPLRSLNQTFKFVFHIKALVKHFLYGSYQEALRQVVTEVRTLCDLLKCGTVHKVTDVRRLCHLLKCGTVHKVKFCS